MPTSQYEKEARSKMEGALVALEHEFATLRTGRATPALFDGVEVDAYGSKSPIKQIASISIPDAKTVIIQPWDKNVMAAIEKAIMAANLGFTPNNDGKVIRINIPQLTEERRKELVKMAHHMAEQSRVAVRNVRRHINDELKKAEKNSEISEDDLHRMIDVVQKMTDEHIEEIGKHLAAKEKEIMEV